MRVLRRAERREAREVAVTKGAPGRTTTSRRGRSRDADVTASILRATLDLAEELGFDALTIEGVAARAGVGKTTIYRRWPSVWAIVMDAFFAEVMELAPIEERATARETLASSMRSWARAYEGRPGWILRSLIGRAQVDPAVQRALRTCWAAPRRRIAADVVRRGIDSGELRADLDVDAVLDALYGPLYVRLLLPNTDHETRISDRYIHQLVDAVFSGLSRRRAPHGSAPRTARRNGGHR